MPAKATRMNVARPEVIVDFLFEDGLFFIVISNIGSKPATQVRITFDHIIMGEGGRKDISNLPLFQNIEFLAPGRTITTFLDSSAAYFARKEPTRIAVQLGYKDMEGLKYKTSILHDLNIYRDISFVPRNIR